MKGNDTLKVLNLGYNLVSDEGAVAIASVVARHRSLIVLYFSDNQYGENGVKALASMLETNTSLSCLSLGSIFLYHTHILVNECNDPVKLHELFLNAMLINRNLGSLEIYGARELDDSPYHPMIDFLLQENRSITPKDLQNCFSSRILASNNDIHFRFQV